MHQIDRPTSLTMPEPWFRDWLEYGYEQITDYLAKHDAYVAYCAANDLEP